MLRRSKDFERALFDFLGNDYDGLNVDKAALPDAGSLVADDGSFVLLRLTGSSLYQDMISAITSISQIAADVFASTPGKAAFDWICSAVSWIEALNKAFVIAPRETNGGTTRNIAISKDNALQLLRNGDDVFLDVPEDLRRTLSEHKIYISSTKEGKLTVKSKKGGAHLALGVVAVRWCPLLYEALKSDVSQLIDWEETLKSVESTYASFLLAWRASSDTSQDSIGRIFDMQESLTDLVYTLKDLVVVPFMKDVESVKDLLHAIETEVMPSMNMDVATAYLNRIYVDGPSVVETRFDRLDALAFRQHVHNGEGSAASSVEGSIEGFGRATARRLLLAALMMAASGLGIPDDEELLFLCSCKAWDVENAVCDQFLGTGFGDAIGARYKEKLRAIKRSLEDTQNKLLHAKVLLGEITPEQFVTMSVEELANPIAQRQRADAEARQNNVLVAPVAASRTVGRDPGNSAAQSNDATSTTVPPMPSTENTNVSTETTKTVLMSKLSAFRDSARASHATRRPSPPPPISFVSQTDTSAETSGGYGVTHTDGGDVFRIHVGGAYHFMAEFHAEGRPGPYISNFLPEQLVETRRSPWKVLDQFLREKVRSGKYQVARLHMHPCSDRDTQILRSFAKDYEDRDRVSTFQIHDDEKVYLITPKFQSLLRDVVPFEKSPATYALMIRSS